MRTACNNLMILELSASFERSTRALAPLESVVREKGLSKVGSANAGKEVRHSISVWAAVSSLRSRCFASRSEASPSLEQLCRQLHG